MKQNSDRKAARLLKRQQIEQEMRQIVLRDSREILRENLRRRRRHEFSPGDRVTIVEWLQRGADNDNDRLYRVTEGVVITALPAGYVVEGRTARGKMARDFVNRAHIINGFVKMFPRE